MSEIKVRNIGDVVYVKCKIEYILEIPINGIPTRAYLLSRDEIYNQANPWIIAYPEDIGLKKGTRIMNEIKVGDEVLIKGKVIDISYIHVDAPTSYRIEYSDDFMTTSFEIPAGSCQKIEPTFIITLQDVGRLARTRSGNKAFIANYEDGDGFIGSVVNEGTCHWDVNGTDDLEQEDNDLVAWWDE